MTFRGQAKEGVSLISQAMRVWPNPPPVYRVMEGWVNYHAGHYDVAARIFEKLLQPPRKISKNQRWAHLLLIATYMKLGREVAARREAVEYKKSPEFPFKVLVQQWGSLPFENNQIQKEMIALIKKAGLEE